MGYFSLMMNNDTSYSKHVAELMCSTFSNEELYRFEDHPYALFGNSIVSVVFYIILAVLLVIFFYKKEKALDFCERYLTYAFFVVWTMGFVIYDIGMYPDHSNSAYKAFMAMLGVAPMAIVHAFGMFVFQSDVSAIHEGCHNNGLFMSLFSVTHLLAALISLVFVIKHFGFNIVSSIIRYWKTHLWLGDIQNLYVFWGMNDATYYLAKDMIKTGKLKDSKIIIIRISNEKENTNEPIGIERLFSFLTLTKNNLENLQELHKLGCLTNSTFGSLVNIQASDSNDILGKELRLYGLVRLIRKTNGFVHLFFLENDEVFNIQAVANLRKDLEIRNFADKENGGKVKFYCHARYNSVHRVIEDEFIDKNIEVKVIDSSHISVELLKRMPKLHPVHYVKIENDATVSSPFNALVVGFGEVGMDAVRFLYEFGAFVKNTNKNIVERSDFYCHVIDKCMDDLVGQFYVNTPSINITMNRSQSEELNMINFYNLDCRSKEFYKNLKQWIASLNYIIVATGDDEANISIAVRMLRLAIRERVGLNRFRILVRVQHDENGHIKKIAEHYNRLWAAEKGRTSKDKNTYQKKIPADFLVYEPITLFGSANQVYTYENVVKESLKEDAKKFKRKYDISVYERKMLSGEKPDDIKDWDEEQNEMMQLTGEYEGYAPTYSSVMKLRRIQSQNVANSLHKDTKKWLAESALGEEGYEEMLRHGLERREGSLIYSWRDRANLSIENVQRVLDVLAQTEHLRWNASHEILGYYGYKDEGFKDEARLVHGCLRDWDKLKENTKSYDYNIVDVSLDLIEIDKKELKLNI